MSKSKNILRLPQVLAKAGLSRSTLYELMDEGDFPKQIKMSKRTSGWIESEVEQWLDDRIAERDGKAA